MWVCSFDLRCSVYGVVGCGAVFFSVFCRVPVCGAVLSCVGWCCLSRVVWCGVFSCIVFSCGVIIICVAMDM